MWEAVTTPVATVYKVQFYDGTSCAWKDIQRTYTTREAALQQLPVGKRARLMAITGKKRVPVDVS